MSRGFAPAWPGSVPRSLPDDLVGTDRLGETVAIVASVFALSCAARLLGPAAPALVVLWGPLAFHYLFRAPVREGARLLFLLAIFLEPPEQIAGCGYWTSPLDGASRVFYDSVKNVTGIPGASLPLSLLATLVLLVRVRGERRRLGLAPPPAFATNCIITFLGAIVAWEAWGIARGGVFDQSYRQIVHMVTGGLMALLFLHAWHGRRDVRAIGTAIVVTAIVRGGLVMWVYFFVCGPLGITPEYCTTHSDSVTFDAAVFVLGAHALEARTRRTLLRFAILSAYLVVVMVMNNRRLAFLGLGAGALVMLYALPKGPQKTSILKASVPALIAAAAYVAIGAESTSPVFAPARLAFSVLAQKDLSSDSRDVENDNLIMTFRENPLFGSGFGFEYLEVKKVYDISEYFAIYRYLPHNSVLWLVGVGGIVGFVLLWLPYLVHGTIASQAYRLAGNPSERAASLAAIGIGVVAMLNDWGDLGRSNYINVATFAAAFALAAHLHLGGASPFRVTMPRGVAQAGTFIEKPEVAMIGVDVTGAAASHGGPALSDPRTPDTRKG